MGKKPDQVLEAPVKKSQGELADAFTGELFTAKSRNHYEEPDPVPFAPPLSVQRPTVRQRIENLIQRGVDPLENFIRQSQEADVMDFEVPDDAEAPLTASEVNYLDSVAAELAEQAPLPDDGLPRPQPAPSTAVPAGVQGAEPPAPGPATGGSEPPPAASPNKPVPTR